MEENQNVYIVMDLGSRAVNGAVVAQDGKPVMGMVQVPTSGNTEKDCTEMLQLLLKACAQLKQGSAQGVVPVAIGISSKGQVKDGVINPGKADALDAKRTLEEKYSIRTEVLNRFDAAARGVGTYIGIANEHRWAVITLSSGQATGVGSGVVAIGKLEQKYTKEKGAGGMTVMKRKSDGAEMSIVDIAGITAINKRITESGNAWTLEGCIDAATKGDGKAIDIIDDVTDAVGELAANIYNEHHPDRVVVITYREILDAKHRDLLLSAAETNARKKLGMDTEGDSASAIRLEDTDLSEAGAKLLGAMTEASSRALENPKLKEEISVQAPLVLAITGPPRAGKTTLVQGLIEELKTQGVAVGGVLTLEIRENGERVGFKMVDIRTGEEAVLAKKEDQAVGTKLRIGNKYNVEEQNVTGFAADVIRKASSDSEVVVIDEIGPMQLLVPGQQFRDAVLAAMSSGKPCVITVKYDSQDELAEKVKNHERTRLVVLSEGSRDIGRERALNILRRGVPLKSKSVSGAA